MSATFDTYAVCRVLLAEDILYKPLIFDSAVTSLINGQQVSLNVPMTDGSFRSVTINMRLSTPEESASGGTG